MKLPRNFFKPLAIGAPAPLRELPVRLERMIHFVPPHIEKAQLDYGQTGLWTRINALNSPWALDDISEIVAKAGNKLDVMMLPKVEGPWDIHYLDQLLAQLEARHK